MLTDKVVDEVDFPLALANERRRLLLARRSSWVLTLLC